MLGLATALNSGSLKKKSVLTNKFSAELDGTGDYIDVSSLSSDLDKGAGTISMWIKVLDTSGNESFFNCSDGDDTDNKIFLIYSTSGTKFQAGYKFAGTSIIAAYTITHDDLIGLGWFHLAMTYNTSTPLIQLFLNGTRVAQRTTSLTTISGDVAIDRIRLGGNSTGNDTYHYGNIDEFIYIAGKDLTETEMLLLYNNGKPDDIGDLPSAINNAIKCWLRFGEGSIDGDADQTSVVFDEKNSTLDSNYLTGTWDSGTGWTNISNGVRATGNGNTRQNLEFTDFVGKVYKLTYTLSNITDSTTLSIKFGGGSTNAVASTNGTHIEYLVNDATVDNFQFISGGNWAGDVTDIVLQKVNGNPGFCVADATVGNVNVP